MYKIMTAGPTQVRENVRQARSLVSTNPDLDEAFYDFYKETCDILAQLMHSSGRAYILGGEGILGREVQELCKRVPYIAEHNLGGPGEGGYGVTIVKFRR